MTSLILFIFLFFAALCIGSFLNVVILRAFTGESIVLPPSKCPKCHERIKWYDNIPVLSYLILRGKCRFCKENISVQYPVVEIITAILFMLIFYKFHFSITSLFLIIIASLSIVISTTDIKEKVVFDAHTISFIVVAVLYNLVQGNIVNSLIGMISAAIIMEGLARLGYLVVKKRAFGEGDTYIAAGIGAMAGIKTFIIILALSILAQAIIILPFFIKKMWENKEEKFAIILTLFLITTATYKSLDYKLELNTLITTIFIISIIILGIYSCVKLLKISKVQEELTHLPFGPSLLITNILLIFFGKEIIVFLSKVF